MKRKTKQKKLANNDSLPIFELTSRMTLFFFLFLVTMLILYATGNYQQFTDPDQRLILYVSAVASALLFLFATAGFVECMGFLIFYKSRKFPLLRLILFILVMILSAVILILLRVVSFLSAGL